MTSQRFHFISDILNSIDNIGANYVSDSYHQLAQQLAPALFLLASIYIGFQFLSAMRGITTYDAMLFSSFKLIAILTGALNYNYFCLFLYDIFTREPLYLFKAMAGPGHGPHTFITINQALDEYLNTGLVFASRVWKMGGLSNLTFIFFGGFLYVFACVSAGLALCLFAITKLLSAAMFSLSPLWIGFAMFEVTKDIFASFIRQLVTYALIPVLASAVLMMTISVTNRLFVQPQHVTLSIVFLFLLLAGLQIYLLMHVYGKAAALASGFAIKALVPTLNQAGANAMGAANIVMGGKLGSKGLTKGRALVGNAVNKGAAATKNYLRNRLNRKR